MVHVSSGFVLLCLPLNQEGETEPNAQAHCPPLPYLAFTAHLVALAEALLLGVAQGVPGHDVITQGHMHAPAGLSLACKRTRHNKIKHAREQWHPVPCAPVKTHKWTKGHKKTLGYDSQLKLKIPADIRTT